MGSNTEVKVLNSSALVREGKEVDVSRCKDVVMATFRRFPFSQRNIISSEGKHGVCNVSEPEKILCKNLLVTLSQIDHLS
jgi:hypothetical protein